MKNKILKLLTLCLFCMTNISDIIAKETPVPIYGPPSEIALDNYLNQFIDEKMNKSLTPGTAFWIYQKDKIDTGRAYGVSNLESGKKVTTNETVFRIASVSKVFVAIAALQQVENGQLELDVDINTYLSLFKVPEYKGHHITMRQLLTHTAGFESQYWGDSTLIEESTESLAHHLARRLPSRIRIPGQFRAYSNYGTALAAYIVETTSGVLFSDFVKQHILLPAGMNSSGYILKDKLNQNLATGYEKNNGELTAMPYTWVHRYPSTSMLTTTSDIRIFIKMLLNDGIGNIGRVLTKSSMNELFKQQYTHDPLLPGMALTFMEMQKHGMGIVWHDGGTVGFQAELLIIPKENAGYFIATNSKGSSFTGELRMGLLEKFYNNNIKPHLFPTIDIQNIERFAGNYAINRINKTSFESFITLTETGENISINEDGFLILWNKKYLPIGKLRFQREDGKRILAFQENVQGEITHMFIDWGGAPRAMKKRSLFEQPLFHGLLLVIILICALIFSITLIIRRFRQSINVKLFEKTLLVNALIPLIFVGLFSIGFITSNGGLDVRLADAPFLITALAFPLILILSTGISLYQLIVNKNFAQNKLSIAVITTSIIFMVWLNHWNLIGYKL